VEGYDRVRSTLPLVRQAGGLPPGYAILGRVRRSLVRSGLHEVRLLSFASAEDLSMTGHTDGVRVTNPLQADDAYLRTWLYPGLLRALGRNLSRQVRGAALFEVGTVFRMADDGAEERPKAAFALTGPATAGWAEPQRPFDFFDAKGVVEALLADLGVADWSLGDPAEGPFHPGRSAWVSIGDERAGAVGELHPKAGERYGLAGRVAVGELEVRSLMEAATIELSAREVPRFPPVRRDLAFIVDAATPAGAVEAALEEAGGDLVGSCLLFDVFSGPPLPEGKRSLAFSIDFRAADRTLTDQETDAVVARIVERVSTEFGAELRAG
jgi:phenylalanyl-tRNA synthetase beta chain